MTDNGQAGRAGQMNGKRTQHFTAGFKTGKGSPYEGGTHVPAFWRWKGVLGEGVEVPALTAHIDLFKTFCELAGAEIPADIQKIDGRSLLPLLENPQADWPDRRLFVHVGSLGEGGRSERQQVQGVRRAHRAMAFREQQGTVRHSERPVREDRRRR